MAREADKPTTLRSAGSVRAERDQRLISRYGGFDWIATFLGFAVSIFFTIVFLGFVGAIVGTVGFQLHTPVPKIGSSITGTTQQLGIGALIGSLVAAFLAYLLGGYTAGRLARFEGVKNGIGVVLWTVVAGIVLGILGAILGNKFDVAKQLHLHVDAGTLTATGLISLAITLIVMLLAAAVGGMLGERYHRSIDREAGIRS
jgi:hypothetical protein